MRDHNPRKAIALDGRFDFHSHQSEESVSLFHFVGAESPVVRQGDDARDVVAEIVGEPLDEPGVDGVGAAYEEVGREGSGCERGDGVESFVGTEFASFDFLGFGGIVDVVVVGRRSRALTRIVVVFLFGSVVIRLIFSQSHAFREATDVNRGHLDENVHIEPNVIEHFDIR